MMIYDIRWHNGPPHGQLRRYPPWSHGPALTTVARTVTLEYNGPKPIDLSLS